MAPRAVAVLLAVEAAAERLDALASALHPRRSRPPLPGNPLVELRGEFTIEVVVASRPRAARLAGRLLEEDGRVHEITQRLLSTGRLSGSRRVDPCKVLADEQRPQARVLLRGRLDAIALRRDSGHQVAALDQALAQRLDGRARWAAERVEFCQGLVGDRLAPAL